MGGHALAGHLRDRDVHLGHVGPLGVLGQDHGLTGRGGGVVGLVACQDGGQGEGQDLDLTVGGARRGGLRRGDGTRGRGCRDVGGAESDELVGAGHQVAGAGQGGELVGVGDAQDFAGFAGGEGLEAHAVGQVGLQALHPGGLEPLRGEEQVDGQRTAQTTDRDEEVREFGLGGEELGELVEDQEEGGHWGEVVLTRDAVGLVIRDVRVVAGVAQDFLAAHHFALEGVLHAVHEGELGLEVGDHGRHVGQARHAREGRAALEVDEDQVELLRRVRQREGEDESAQHL